jgi:hypothetical protein
MARLHEYQGKAILAANGFKIFAGAGGGSSGLTKERVSKRRGSLLECAVS